MNSRIIGSLCAVISVVCFQVNTHASTPKGTHSNLPTQQEEPNEYAVGSSVQEDPNASGDNILGSYLVEHKGEKSKVKITKNSDGTYTAQVYWVLNRTESDGSVRKDVKNPDKSLRNVDCDKIVIFKGLKYDSSSKSWSGGTIYDPVRGINASLKASFKDAKTLTLKGTKMGFSETVTWIRL